MHIVFALALSVAQAQEGETISYTVEEVAEDLGNLHVTVLAGTSFAAQERFFVGGTAFFEVSPNLAADIGVFLPMARIDSDLGPWFQFDGAVRLHGTRTVIEHEPIELGRWDSGSTRTVSFINVPTATRNSKGLSLGLMGRAGTSRLAKDDKTRTDSFHLMPTIGISAVQAVGTRVDIEGYGKRSQFRWTGGGVDLVVDGIRTYETDPVDPMGRFGARLYNTAAFGRTNHPSLGGRVELGYLPGGQGLYFMFGIGGALNLGI